MDAFLAVFNVCMDCDIVDFNLRAYPSFTFIGQCHMHTAPMHCWLYISPFYPTSFAAPYIHQKFNQLCTGLYLCHKSIYHYFLHRNSDLLKLSMKINIKIRQYGDLFSLHKACREKCPDDDVKFSGFGALTRRSDLGSLINSLDIMPACKYYRCTNNRARDFNKAFCMIRNLKWKHRL